jgi:hypothetical protein
MTEVFGDFKENRRSKCLVRICDCYSSIVTGTEMLCWEDMSPLFMPKCHA